MNNFRRRSLDRTFNLYCAVTS